jgi:hypothetical protein
MAENFHLFLFIACSPCTSPSVGVLEEISWWKFSFRNSSVHASKFITCFFTVCCIWTWGYIKISSMGSFHHFGVFHLKFLFGGQTVEGYKISCFRHCEHNYKSEFMDEYGSYNHRASFLAANMELFIRDLYRDRMILYCEADMEHTPQFKHAKEKYAQWEFISNSVRKPKMEPATEEFVKDMQEGDYAPAVNNQIRRLNEVTKKWEQKCKSNPNLRPSLSPPKVRRQSPFIFEK